MLCRGASRARSTSTRARVDAVLTWAALLLIVALGGVPGESRAATTASGAPRIVAIGDVHGSFDGLMTILESTGLTDERGRWIGENALLVQTGDLTDRGADVRQVFDALMRLQDEANAAGGGVITLLGNHEISNLLSVFSSEDTAPEVFERVVAAFADEKSEKRRQQGLRRHRSWAKRFPGCGAVDDDQWLAAHPLGTVEYIEALSPRGKYGKWLRSFDTVVELQGTIFVHGGLSPALEEMGFTTIVDINRRIGEELAAHDRTRAWLEANRLIERGAWLPEMLCAVDSELYRRTEGAPPSGLESDFVKALRAVRASLPSSRWLANHPEGPLWFRGYAHWSDEEGEEAIPRLRELFGVNHFVVGHTPQPGTIKERFAGGVFLIDTALVFGREAGGGPAALEIRDGVFSALYPEERVVLWPRDEPVESPAAPFDPSVVEWRNEDGRLLPFTSAAELEEFLASASVVAVEEIPLGITEPKRLLLEHNGVRARAAFRHYHETAQMKQLTSTTILKFRDSFRNEVAAYHLSELLGMRRVPPTVSRTVDGTEGSVQIWVENTVMERDRQERDLEPPDTLLFQRQNYDMKVFDNLIGNFDRNQGNILIDEDWRLWLIDHTRAFRAVEELPEEESVARCSKALWRALTELGDGEIERVMGDYLPPAELEALLGRRGRVVEILRQRIDTLGDAKVVFEWDDPNPDVRVYEAPLSDSEPKPLPPSATATPASGL